MRRVRTYTFEMCWLVLLMLFWLASPSRPAASMRNWIEEAPSECDDTPGWCPEI